MISIAPPTLWFEIGTAVAWFAVVVYARAVRNRQYATFLSVMLGIHALASLGVFPHTGPAWPLAAYLQAAVFVHFAVLTRPTLRGALYRTFVSIPGSWFVAACFLSVPWSVARGLGFHPWAPWLPFAIALAGLVDSLWAAEDDRHVWLDGSEIASLQRHFVRGEHDDRPLRIVQITDPHIGPFMSVAALREVCARAVARDPDLVLLTGDLLTMESQRDPAWLTDALAPLKAFEGRTFACLGNHDHEALDTVKSALVQNGVKLLVDDMVRVDTPAGRVEIIGFDFVWRDRAEHLRKVTDRFARESGTPRVAMLHDPGAFRHLPAGTADLVLSGHTHGGQLGLLRLGLHGTVVSALSKVPDHGPWALGRARLYVHRGTGHYGFPLRIGVPAERSLLHVHGLWRSSQSPAAEVAG